MLDLFKEHYKKNNDKSKYKFIQVSTDEVYGDLTKDSPSFTEQTKYSPNNPYSASKAAGDHLVFSYVNTYNLPLTVTNCSNNYGPNQHREKLIPKTIYSMVNNKTIPIYGNGTNIRDWIYVDDHCDALIKIIKYPGYSNHFNIGGNCELENIHLVKLICNRLLEKLKTNTNYEKLIEFVNDRPGHDYRYSIDNSFITKTIDWRPQKSLSDGISETVDFYLKKFTQL